MKRKNLFLLIMTLSLAITACENDNKENARIHNVTTINVEQGVYCSAYASGQISGFNPIALDFECGIEYSTKKSFDKDSTWQVKVKTNYSEVPYTVGLYPIESERTYYYRAYCINQLLIYYGETKQFSFYWESRDDYLIGTWDATDGCTYVFNDNHTGTSGKDVWYHSMEWSVNLNNLYLIYKDRLNSYLVIKSLIDSKMEAYDIHDPDKVIITFTKR